MERFDIDNYVKQFHVIGVDEYINCNSICIMLYNALISKFKITFTKDEYPYFKEYQERIFDLVENMRQLDNSIIHNILSFLEIENHYLVDIIIMSWCLPRSDTYLSQNRYKLKYKDNIIKFQSKLIHNITQSYMQKFCLDFLSKSNNLPIHCIDYIWYYMNALTIEFEFYNNQSANYIGINLHNDRTITLGLNLEYILFMGLGNFEYSNKGSFKKFFIEFIQNDIIVSKTLESNSGCNFFTQLKKISQNLDFYFGNDLLKLPPSILQKIDFY